MVFLCSKRQLQLWDTHRPPQLFVDGYHKVPKDFTQMISLMGFFPKLQRAFPIIHCLINSKTQDNYQKMFIEIEGILKTALGVRSISMDTETVTTDFEKGLINASEWFWPEKKIMGCFVHFLRAQITRLKTLGFQSNEKKKKSYQVLTLMSTLPFVEVSKVEKVFKRIVSLEEFAEYNDYFDYFESTWLKGYYPISIWSVDAKKDDKDEFPAWLKHSNNLIESFHSLLKFILRKSEQPTITEFIEGLAYIEANSMNTLYNYKGESTYDVSFFSLSYCFNFLGN